MKSGITITEYELMFNGFPTREIGFAKYSKPFRVALDNIKEISLSLRFVLDDDSTYINIITKDGNVHQIPYTYCPEDFEAFEKHFDLYPIHLEELKFECGDYTDTIDKIVYPKKLYWHNRIENNKKPFFRNFFSRISATASIFNF